jgi:hypothetical protein
MSRTCGHISEAVQPNPGRARSSGCPSSISKEAHWAGQGRDLRTVVRQPVSGLEGDYLVVLSTDPKRRNIG